LAWRGKAWRGKAGEAGRGLARRGKAGMARVILFLTIYTGLLMTAVAEKTKTKQSGDVLVSDKVSVKMALQEIYQKSGGLITAQNVLDHAVKKSHPLHDYFEWDDSEAAKKYRLDQARDLIQRVKITIETPNKEPVEFRAFVSLESDRSAGGGYRHITQVIKNATMLQEFHAEVKRVTETWEHKAGVLGLVFSANEIQKKILGT
jgi:hypothetical protein